MSTPWKLLTALGLVLPTGAFVAGALTAPSVDRSVPGDGIVIHQRQPGPGDSHPSQKPPNRQSSPTTPALAPAGNRVAGSGEAERSDDHGPRVVSTEPDEPGDEADHADDAGEAQDARAAEDRDGRDDRGRPGDDAAEDHGPEAHDDHSGPGGGHDEAESDDGHRASGDDSAPDDSAPANDDPAGDDGSGSGANADA